MPSAEHTTDMLYAQIAELCDEIRHLRQENTDSKLLNDIQVEHGEVVVDDLFHVIENNSSLYYRHITRLRQEIEALHQKVTALEQEKTDLEMLIEMNVEHADYLEEDLLNKVESTLR